MPTIIDHIIVLYREKGSAPQSGSVTRLQHALQTARLAEQSGAGPHLVAAALLHGIGHLLPGRGWDLTGQGVDDLHEERGARFLEAHFSPQVTGPIRLHVAAKRYLCTTDADYLDHLPQGARDTLELQGGLMTPEEIEAFESSPYFQDAVALRKFDDAAKTPVGDAVPDLGYYRPTLEQALHVPEPVA